MLQITYQKVNGIFPGVCLNRPLYIVTDSLRGWVFDPSYCTDNLLITPSCLFFHQNPRLGLELKVLYVSLGQPARCFQGLLATKKHFPFCEKWDLRNFFFNYHLQFAIILNERDLKSHLVQFYNLKFQNCMRTHISSKYLLYLISWNRW